MSLEEANKIFKSIVAADRKYRVLLLIVGHGARPGEAVRLHVSDFVKADCTEFYIQNTKVAYNGRSARRDLKIVPPWVGKEIRNYVEEAYANGELKGGYLFPTCQPGKYKHMQRSSINVWFARKRKELGMDEVVDVNKGSKAPQYRITPYSFRRLFATEMAFAGADQRVIATLMGHKDLSITSQYQNKARILELAPQQVKLMPQFLGQGQTTLSNFTDVSSLLIKPSEKEQTQVLKPTPAAERILRRSYFKRVVKQLCQCGEPLRISKLGTKLQCKKCWEYYPLPKLETP